MSKVYFHTDSNNDVYFSIGLLSQDFVAWRYNVLEPEYTKMASELFSWLSVNSPHEISTHDLVVNSSNNNFIKLLDYMNSRKRLENNPTKVEILSLLHFKYKNNTLMISEQPLDVKSNHIRYIHYLQNSAIAQWCADNSPLYLANIDAINLLNCQEWSNDYCLSFLADVKKDYKKPMPKQNDVYAIVEPVSTYRMTFYHNGQSCSYEHYEPFYFVRKCEPTEQYPLGFEPVIGKHHNAVALPTNGDKYVILAPCHVEEIKPLWTVARPDNYQLEYKNTYIMDFDADAPCINLVNWFLETQPELTDEQLQIIDDNADVLNALKLFKAMYK